ncbi:MAG TPA: hypothetical protein VNU68_30770 [Verrucomicrobiae bacterium]|nr:hypothetical protein [Verrucomicrobiae bacterium]
MRRFLLPLLFALSALTPAISSGELIVYRGTRRDNYNGSGHSLTVLSRLILIVDHDTAQAARLQYESVNGVKRYSTSQWTNTHFVEVTGTRVTYTAIARMLTPCEIDSGATGEGIYCKGANATLTLNTNSTVFFPKILSDHGNGLGHSQISGEPFLDDGSFQLVFDRPGTLTSNQAGETLDAAFARFTAYLESLGYARQ